MKKILKNFCAILFGCFFALILVELLFWLLFFFLSFETFQPDENAYRIVCVGDSSTYGIGSSIREQFSYPAQLKKVFPIMEGKETQTINLGLPGINSSQAFLRLKKHINHLKPHLILVCVGVNDAWNWEETDFYPGDRIQNLKIFRFLKLLRIHKDWGADLLFQTLSEPVPEFNKKTVSRNDRLLPNSALQKVFLEKTLKKNFLLFQELASEYKSKLYFMEYHAEGWQHPEILIHELYRKLQLNVVPVFEFFKKADQENKPIRSKDGWHLNDLGYAMLVRLIKEEIF